MTNTHTSTQRTDLGIIASSHDRRPKERADAAANRVLIMVTAEKLFAEKGVDGVTMADIAQMAKIGKGTLYRRFKNKGALCLALMEDQLITFQDMMLERFRKMTVDEVSPLNQLAQFLEAVVYFSSENMQYLCEINKGGVGIGDHTVPYFWLHLTVKGLLNDGIRVGELPASFDSIIVADLLLGAISTQQIRSMLNERRVGLDQINAGIQALLNLRKICV